MPEENKELNVIIQEVKEGVIEAVVPAVTKEVITAVEKKIAEVKPTIVDKDQKTAESQKETVEMFKDMYSRLENGEKTVSKTLDTTTEESGKEIVPEYFNSEVKRIAEKHGVIRRDADVVPMQGKVENWPTMGGVSVYRVNEKGKIPVISPTTGQIKLTAKKLAAIIPMSREVVAYSNVSVIDKIAQLSGEATARAEDYWGFRGLSAGEGIFQNEDVPLHIMGSGNTDFADVDFADLLALQNLIDDHAFSDGNLKYYLRRSVLNALRAKILADSDSVAQALVAMSLKDLLSLPYETVPVLPSTLDENDGGEQAGQPFMGLYNLKNLMFGVARSYEVEMSREATINSDATPINLWEQDMVAIRVMESVDIQLANPDKAFATLQTAES